MRRPWCTFGVGCLLFLPVLFGCDGDNDAGDNDGGEVDGGAQPVAGVWTPMSTLDAPSPRRQHSAVWTDDEMIVWGGRWSSAVGDGGRYDPVSDSWRSVSADGAPIARSDHIAVWTGDEMIVWSGNGATAPVGDGGRYDPASDEWRPISDELAPAPRSEAVAVWTGREVIVWGGYGATGDLGQSRLLGDGGRYDPVADTWQPIATTGAPPEGSLPLAAVWTGDEMFVWVHHGLSDPLFGVRYSPERDTWSPVSTDGDVTTTGEHTAWTGSQVIVFGPNIRGGGMIGALYDPGSDSWSPTSAEGAPPVTDDATSVWTGTQLIVWGGDLPFVRDDEPTGGVYTAASDSWVATALPDTLGPRTLHTAVWTGTEMIVWGGRGERSDGARFRP